MRTIDYLLKVISKIEGNLLGIGISDSKILKKIDENPNITTCNLLDDTNQSNSETTRGKQKKISFNKLRKIFKKKKIDYLIVDEKIINDKDKNFISDSIYITKNTIIYLTSEKEKIVKKYSRYSVEIEEIKCLDRYVLKIKVGNAKNNRLKEKIYQVLDFFVYIIDTITDLLLN